MQLWKMAPSSRTHLCCDRSVHANEFNERKQHPLQLALRRRRLRSVAFVWSVFVDGLGQQQCQFVDTYIVIFTPSIFGRDVTGFQSPCDDKIPAISQSSLLDPPFVVCVMYVYAVLQCASQHMYCMQLDPTSVMFACPHTQYKMSVSGSVVFGMVVLCLRFTICASGCIFLC